MGSVKGLNEKMREVVDRTVRKDLLCDNRCFYLTDEKGGVGFLVELRLRRRDGDALSF